MLSSQILAFATRSHISQFFSSFVVTPTPLCSLPLAERGAATLPSGPQGPASNLPKPSFSFPRRRSMNGWIFDFGRTLALGSMMATPLLPVLCGGPPVSAAAAIVGLAADPEADFHNFQSLAWAALWNVPYLQGKSGMLLEASTVQSAWQVVAFHDHDLDYEDPTLTEEDINAQFVAQGSYVEATRILL